MTNLSRLDFIVTQDEHGQRLDRLIALRQRNPPDRPDQQNALGLSRMRIQTLIKQGEATIIRNAQTYSINDPSWQVKSDDKISLNIPPIKPTKLIAQPIPLQIVYEDDSLIVINKPAGLVVHPAPGNLDNTLVNALMAHCGDSLSGIGGEKRPGIVHRLDKDTSGIMVAAKHDRAHKSLSAQFAAHGRDGRMQRIYEALVWGQPLPMTGRIEAALARHPKARKKMHVVKEHVVKEHASKERVGKKHVTKGHATKQNITTKWARFAATQYVTRQSWGAPPLISHVKCILETGRTHQIRVHMAHIGCPVIGDGLYGSGQMSRVRKLPADLADNIKTLNRQALHAGFLAFEHPITSKPMQFEAPLPDDMRQLLDRLASTFQPESKN